MDTLIPGPEFQVSMKLRYLCRLGSLSLVICIIFLYFIALSLDIRLDNLSAIRFITSGDQVLRNGTKKILFWNSMFGNRDFYFGQGHVFAKCPVNECYVTHDRTSWDLGDFDAVLFHGNELDVDDIPAKRTAAQYYVFVNLESPENRPLRIPFFERFFNLTMTYRLDSDILWNYGSISDKVTGELVAPSENPDWSSFWKGEESFAEQDPSIPGTKTKAVTWFVSNCQAKSGRFNYVRELQRYIQVDIYGECGQDGCPRDKDCISEVVEPNYYFYLSFENSLCDDYVTEKLFNPLRYNVVPIVYGGANYSRFAPPHSHINALDFDSPADLAAHLKGLMRDPVEYRKYFRWKKFYRVDASNWRTTCRLCEFLHAGNTERIYDPLSDWFEREKCLLQRRLGENKYATRRTLIGRG